MGRRRRQSKGDVFQEGIVTLVALLVFGLVMTGGAAALRAYAAVIVAVLVGVPFLALLVWWLWRYNARQHLGPAVPEVTSPKVRPAPSPYIIPFPPEAPAGSSLAREAVPPPAPRSSSPAPSRPAAAAVPHCPAPTPVRPAPPANLTDQFRNLDWFQFEKIVALIYRKLGDRVERRGGAHADGGIDLLLHRDGSTFGVQCKHWKTWQIGVKTIREFLGALTAAGLKDGIFVALGKFTPDAAALASRHGIRLVDAADLAELVERAGVHADADFQAALTDTRKYCPKCERELVLRTATKGQNLGGQFWGCSAYPRCSYILRT